MRSDNSIDYGFDSAGIAHLFHAALVHDSGRVFILVEHGGKHFTTLLGRNSVIGKQAHQLDGALGSERAIQQVERRIGVHAGTDVVKHEIRKRLGEFLCIFSGNSHCPLKEARGRTVLHQVARVI